MNNFFDFGDEIVLPNFKFLNYVGTKFNYLAIYKDLLSKLHNIDTYIEPFVGGGSLYFNLSDKYDNIIINDKNDNLMQIYKSFKSCESYEYLKSFYNESIIKFGNIGLDKQSYYSFRDYTNTLSDIDKGLGWFYCSRSAINSMARWGPNGFNQSYGARGKDIFLTEEIFDRIKLLLNATHITSGDYSKLISYDSPNAVWILDPPYINSSMSYSNIKSNTNEFIQFVLGIKGKIIYSDFYDHSINDALKFNIVKLRDVKNISPNRSSEQNMGEEVIYYNF
jgi:site-specific DNA-adenine methylase